MSARSLLAERGDHPAARRLLDLEPDWRAHPKYWAPDLRADVERCVLDLGGSAAWLLGLRKALGLVPLTEAELREADERAFRVASASEARRKAASRAERALAYALPPLRVALIGCGKTKLDGSHPARALYTGPLFRAALAHAERTADRVYVVSARYGLLDLDRVILSYDETLSGKPKREREDWGDKVTRELFRRLAGRRVEVTILAGQDYASPIAHRLYLASIRPDSTVLAIERPLTGLGVGQRLAWFRERAPRAARPATLPGFGWDPLQRFTP